MNRYLAAFTLIELLVASAAVSLLAVGILVVLAAVTRQTARETTRQANRTGGEARLLRLVRSDLAAARIVTHGSSTTPLVMFGHCGLDADGERDGTVVSVEYSLRRSGEAFTLVRSQTPFDPHRSQFSIAAATSRRAVWYGVTAYDVRPVPIGADGSATQLNSSDGPAAYELTLRTHDGRNLNETLILR